MTSLRRALPVAFPLALICASITPRDAGAILRPLSAARDLSLEVASPMGEAQDASPSLVSTPTGTYVGWVRTPVDPAVTTWSTLVLSRATRAGVDHTPPDHAFTNSYLYDASLAYDGSAVIAIYTHGSTLDSNVHFAIWQSALDRIAEVGNAPGRSLDLSSAPFVDHNTIPVAIAYAPPAAPGGETGRFVFQCDGSYSGCMATGSMYDTVHFDGRAAFAAGEARFFMSRANGTNTDLQAPNGVNLAAVPNAQRVVSDFFARDTGEFVTLTVVAPNAVSVSLIDAALALHPLVPDPVMTAGTVDEVAIAPDQRGGPAWIAALENSGSSIEVIAQDLGSTALVSVPLPVPATVARCQRLHIANFAGEPDLLAVVAQCGNETTGHIFYWTVQRQPDVSADAGVDVIEVDASLDASVEGGADVASDAAGDVGADTADAVADAEPSFDVQSPTPGTGPGFRGSGCNCAVPGRAPSSGAYAWLALGATMAMATRARRRR